MFSLLSQAQLSASMYTGLLLLSLDQLHASVVTLLCLSAASTSAIVTSQEASCRSLVPHFLGFPPASLALPPLSLCSFSPSFIWAPLFSSFSVLSLGSLVYSCLQSPPLCRWRLQVHVPTFVSPHLQALLPTCFPTLPPAFVGLIIPDDCHELPSPKPGPFPVSLRADEHPLHPVEARHPGAMPDSASASAAPAPFSGQFLPVAVCLVTAVSHLCQLLYALC